METSLAVTHSPTQKDRDAIFGALIAFNDAAAGPSGFEPVAVLLRNNEIETIGGLWGKLSYDWLSIDFLIVPSNLRGQGWGRKLIDAAEEVAIQRGCVGIWLDTHGFQAPDFYKALGYEVFGELRDYPRGVSRYFLNKLLA